MNIGTAIKTLRKEKGFSQRDLASACGISTNAMSQIESNATFPQKKTIQKICEILRIPISYLLFFSISEDDIPEDKRIVFESLNGAIKSVLLDTLS